MSTPQHNTPLRVDRRSATNYFLTSSRTTCHPYSTLQRRTSDYSVYWSNYYTLFDFPSDVPTLISLSELRKVIRLQPQNIITLTQLLISKLDSLVHSESTKKALADRESPEERPRTHTIYQKNTSPNNLQTNSFTDQLKGFSQKVPSTLLNGAADIVGVGGSHNKLPKGPLREILNCVWVLTRILPLLIEEASGNDPSTPTANSFSPRGDPLPSSSSTSKSSNDKAYWINNLLWGTLQPDSFTKEDNDDLASPNPQNQPPQFVLDEDEEDAQDSSETVQLVQERKPIAQHDGNTRSTITAFPSKPPLLVTLIDTILDLLFLPGVCVPALSNQTGTSRYPIWTGGIGSSQIPSDHSQAHNSAKVEVLRLLLAVLSKPLFSAPHLYSTGGLSIQDILGSPADELDPFRATLGFPNPALTYLCTKTSKPLLLALLCSLINTALAPTRNNFSSPASALNTLANGLGRITQGKIGIGSPHADLPPSESSASLSPTARRPSLTPQNSSTAHYGGASSAGITQDLPGWCAAVLSVLLLPDPANFAGSPFSTTERKEFQEADRPKVLELNGFRMYLSKVHRPADLSFLVDNLLVILMKPMKVTSQLLSSDSVVGSTTLIGSSFLNYGCGLTEAMLLLHLALDCNPRLVSHLITTGKISSVIIALTFICLEQKDSQKPKTGLVKLCAITLQLLTAHDRKELSHIINSKVDLPVGIRAQYSVPGTLADFLIVSICSVIFSTTTQFSVSSSPNNLASHAGGENGTDTNLNTTFTSLVLTLTNLSPFLKDLSAATSTRLSQLFLFFSSPGFLLREEGNVKLLYYVLEIFNNVIHYQMPDNPHLIYAMIKVHQRFESLATFTLKEGLKEIERAKQRRQSTPKKLMQGGMGRCESVGDGSPGDVRRGSGRTGSIDEGGEGKIFDADEHDADLPKSSTDKGKGKWRDPLGDASKPGLALPSTSASSSSDLFQVVGSHNSSSSFDHASAPASDSWTDINQPPRPTLDSNPSSLGRILPQSVGRNGFIPSESWVASWRDSLPLDTIQIMLMIRSEGSKVETKPSLQAINLLKSATLIGMLPPPNKRWKRARRFELHHAKAGGGLNWIGSFVWSLIFIKDSNSMAGNFLAGSHPTSLAGSSSSSLGSIINMDGGTTGTLRIKLFGVLFLPRRSSSGIVRDLFKPFSSNHNSPLPLPPSRDSSLSDLSRLHSSDRDPHSSG
ncbi:hypothetical protein VP01_469g7 [Puccinia sorghi]|uniref:Uncharacterized protein n=1 Tax=Puccinia sorghi TaxID=27349 RepID=A0A0L6UN18_9BASI|nr:hypothetical protein VP01_469g7 [Puccinia sorghi]